MWPGLRDGDLVRIEPLSLSEVLELPCGTVILLVRDGDNPVAVVHRLVGCDGSAVYERGDRGRRVTRVDAGRVIGRVVARRRAGRETRVSVPVPWHLRNLLNRLRRSR